jgi:hypothetical protein
MDSFFVDKSKLERVELLKTLRKIVVHLQPELFNYNRNIQVLRGENDEFIMTFYLLDQ